MSTINVKDEKHDSTTVKDDELDGLLNDALQDFDNSYVHKTSDTKKETETHSVKENEFDYSVFGNIWDESSMNEVITDIEKCMKSLFSIVLNDNVNASENINRNNSQDNSDESKEYMNKFPEHLLKMAENMFNFDTEELVNECTDCHENDATKSLECKNTDLKNDSRKFHDTILKTINSLYENIKDLNGSFLNNFEGFKNLLSNNTVNDNDFIDDIEMHFTNNFLSFVHKFIFPPLKELCEKYPSFFEKNNNLSKEDYIYYQNQYKLMTELCQLYEDKSINENKKTQSEKFKKIFRIMWKIQNFGEPPKELVE